MADWESAHQLAQEAMDKFANVLNPASESEVEDTFWQAMKLLRARYFVLCREERQSLMWLALQPR
jgi:hypothetical protein